MDTQPTPTRKPLLALWSNRAAALLAVLFLVISMVSQIGAKSAAAQGEPGQPGQPEITSSQSETGDNEHAASTENSAGASLQSLPPESDIGDYTDVTFFVLVDKQWVKVNSDGTLYDAASGNDYQPVRITTHDANWGGQDRMVITGTDLYDAYKNFGFTSKSLYDPSSAQNRHGYRIFANTLQGSEAEESLIWADGAKPWYSENTGGDYSDPAPWQVGLRVSKNDAGHYQRASFVFYVPNNKPGNSAFFDNSAGTAWAKGMPVNNADMKAANTFYSLYVTDPLGIVEQSALPATSYTLTGGNAEVTLPALAANASWHVFATGSKEELTEGVDYQKETDAEGNIVFSFSNVTAPHIISTSENASTKVTLNFDVSVTNATSAIGHIWSQVVVRDGSFDDGGTKTSLVWTGDKEQTVPWPQATSSKEGDPILAITADAAELTKNQRKLCYAFNGWKAEGSDTVFGKDATLDEIVSSVGGHSDTVDVLPVWSVQTEIPDEGYRISSANFYVSLTSKVLGADESLQENYSPSLAVSYVGDTGIFKRSVYGNESSLVSTPIGNSMAYDADHTIRRMDTNAEDFEQYKGVCLYGVPTDEEALKSIRDAAAADPANPKVQVTLDGVRVDPQDLTTENFSVRWYTMKYHKDDGWHVDGILVHKTQDVVVTKTFLGSSALYSPVAADRTNSASDYNLDSDFYILAQETPLVSRNEEDAAAQPAEAKLILKKTGALSQKDSQHNCIGYSSVETSETGAVTYTWKLSAATEQQCTLTEHNTGVFEGQNACSGWYKTYNTDETHGGNDIWKDVPGEGVVIRTKPQDTDISLSDRQTVAFRNIYAEGGSIAMRKIDELSGDGLDNIAFTVSNADGTPIAFNLHKLPGTSCYTSTSGADEQGYTETIAPENGRLTVETDADGFLFAKLPSGTYYLEEVMPDGYFGATKIKLQVSAAGERHIFSVVETSEAAGVQDKDSWVESDWDAGSNMAFATVKNRSQVLLSVTAQIKWNRSDIAGDTEPQISSVFLHCNDRIAIDKRGETMKAIISPTPDENGLYLATWTNLPLYVDGDIARYTIYQQEIGSDVYDKLYDIEYDPVTESFNTTLHTQEDSHGFIDYKLSYARACYAGQLPGDDSGSIDAQTVSQWVSEGVFDQSEPVWTDALGATVRARHLLLTVEDTLGAGTISFVKTDENEEPLAGATFEMYEANPDTHEPVAKTEHIFATSDENGKVEFTRIVDGVKTNLFPAKSYYYFREVSAPSGYALSGSEFRVRVHDYLAQMHEGTFSDGTAICDMKDRADSGDGWETTIQDFKLYSLPTAGGPGVALPTLIGALFVSIAVYYLVARRAQKPKLVKTRVYPPL